MNEKKLKFLINYSNQERYTDGHIVEEYLQEPYHKERITVAITLLTSYLAESFPTLEKSSMTVIDIGCGSGQVAQKLKSMGYSVVAADYSESVLFPEEKRLKKLIFDASETFPIPDHSFHCIFSGELIEHLYDTAFFLQECSRILTPGGILILTTPNLAGLDDRLKFLVGKSPRHVNPLHPYLKLHIRQFTKSSLTKIVKLFGFDDVVIKSNFIKIYLKNERKAQNRFFAKLFPGLGGSLICAARKVAR